VFDREDPESEFGREPPRTSWLPMVVAILIVMASISLAVWRLRYEPLVDPPQIREVMAEPAARPVIPPTPVPAATRAPAIKPSAPPTVAPTASAAPARTNVPLNTLASAAIRTATAAPTSLALLPRPRATPSRKDDDGVPTPSLVAISPRKVKRGSTTLLDVRGKSLTPGNHVFVTRSGRVPPDIAVPRHRFVDPTLMQVLVIVGMNAPKGGYELRVSGDDGRRSNAVQFEVTP
jgi:hypothetical protein